MCIRDRRGHGWLLACNNACTNACSNVRKSRAMRAAPGMRWEHARRLPRCCCSIPIPHSRSHPPNALLNVVHMLHAQELGAWQHQSVCWPLPCQCCRRCTACCCHPLPPAHVHLFVHTCHLLLLGSIESSPLHTPMLLLCCMPRRCLAAAAPRACRRTATAPTAAVLPCRPRPRAPIGPRPWPSSREG